MSLPSPSSLPLSDLNPTHQKNRYLEEQFHSAIKYKEREREDDGRMKNGIR
jgi:hypothetical protein